MTVKPSNNIRRKEPADARLILNQQYTSSNTAPSTESPTGSFEVGLYHSVDLVVSADDSTGSGDSLDIIVWRYRRKTSDDPLGGGATFFWSKGETISLDDIGYSGSNKEFSIPTNGAEKLYYEMSTLPAVSWVNLSSYVGVPRSNSVAVLNVGSSSTSGAASGGAVSDTVLEDVHDASAGLLRVSEQDPLSSNYVFSTLASVTNATDGNYYYYVDMAGFRQAGFQLQLNGGTAGAGPSGVTATFEATMQADGTDPASCTYQDLTTELWGGSLVATPGNTSSDMWSDDVKKLANFKYVRIKIVADTNGNSGDWTIYSSKLY
jgi:hypothetical protein